MRLPLNKPILQVELIYSFTTEEQKNLCLVKLSTEDDSRGFLLQQNEIPSPSAYKDSDSWLTALKSVVFKC